MGKTGGKWQERLKFTLLFVALTVLVHHGIGWMEGWVKPFDPYKVPEGTAAKVFQAGADNGAAPDLGERLKLFLWIGE